jgi:DNA-binding response OmpR family regulator
MSDSMQIVVADDDPVLRALLQMKLQAEGHNVTLACEVTRRLREQPETATLPIVLLTGRDTDPDIVAGWQSGANYYITKPFVIEHLRYFIQTMQDMVEPPEPWDDTVD